MSPTICHSIHPALPRRTTLRATATMLALAVGTMTGLALAVSGCENRTLIGFTKQDAIALDGVDPQTGQDLCRQAGWYDDGECDTFCVEPDPDCGSNPPGGCFSPDRNLDTAYDSGAIGCSCQRATDEDVCATDSTGKKVALICEEDGVWHAVNDGPCGLNPPPPPPDPDCFSPTQNVELATDPDAVGCRCSAAVEQPICVDGGDLGRLSLACDDGGRWSVVTSDGICDERPPGCFEIFPRTDDEKRVTEFTPAHGNPATWNLGTIPLGTRVVASINYFNFCSEERAIYLGSELVAQGGRGPGDPAYAITETPAPGYKLGVPDGDTGTTNPPNATIEVTFDATTPGLHGAKLLVYFGFGTFETTLQANVE